MKSEREPKAIWPWDFSLFSLSAIFWDISYLVNKNMKEEKKILFYSPQLAIVNILLCFSLFSCPYIHNGFFKWGPSYLYIQSCARLFFILKLDIKNFCRVSKTFWSVLIIQYTVFHFILWIYCNTCNLLLLSNNCIPSTFFSTIYHAVENILISDFCIPNYSLAVVF